jgi:hypothetical protein
MRLRLLVPAVAVIAACGGGKTSAPPDTSELSLLDTAAAPPVVPAPEVAAPSPAPAVRLSPTADSIAGLLVFPPVTERLFIVVSRSKRAVLDIGRVDVEVRRDSVRARAFREAVAARSPIPVGTVFSVRAPFGTTTVRVAGFDGWNGRVVARLTPDARLDSAAAASDRLVGLATRGDSTAVASADACERRLTGTGRLDQLRDSVFAALLADGGPPYERLRKVVKRASSRVPGCFGAARAALAVTVYAGDHEWVRERIFLVEPSGRAIAVRVTPHRFQAHELIGAFDTDGDGVDDLAARGRTYRAGGTVVLQLDSTRTRATRIAGGFHWEVF